ncbi:MAG: JDVT-CTERM domain-containing protein, partial [Gammaproteobacteria bacterium]|nr:JDVT-CTERM domain-containing protein [Gammaproteobacteria bacterium]
SDAGDKVGDEFSVLDLPENISIFSAYELNSNYDGLTTFIWHGYAPEGGSDYAYLRNFQIDGTPLSASYSIIPSGTSEHHVAINNNGQIVVTWGEDRQGIRNDSTNLNDLKYYISASINPVEYIPPSTSGGSGGGGCSLNQKSEYDPLFFILIITSMMYIHRRRFSHYKIKSSQQI